MKKGYIFDMDGTLLDSFDAWVDIGNSYLRSIGKREESGLDEVLKDKALKEGALYMQEHFGLNQSVEEIIQSVCDLIEAKYMYEIQLYPGVQDFLQRCYD